METVWVLGDQLNRSIGALRDATPAGSRILLVESRAKLASKAFHCQRLHLVLAAMRAFAGELRRAGFEVDYRQAPSLAAGLDAHRRQFAPERVRVTEPASWDGLEMVNGLGVEVVRSDQFMCHYRDFEAWAGGRSRLRMEDFYRWRRMQTGYLMDGDQPAGGRWNFDSENRRPAPSSPLPWPRPQTSRATPEDERLLAELPPGSVGEPETGTWATTRRGALARLHHVIEEVLPYAAGGAYISRMSDPLRSVPLRPQAAHRGVGVPVHHPLLGLHRPQPGGAGR